MLLIALACALPVRLRGCATAFRQLESIQVHSRPDLQAPVPDLIRRGRAGLAQKARAVAAVAAAAAAAAAADLKRASPAPVSNLQLRETDQPAGRHKY